MELTNSRSRTRIHVLSPLGRSFSTISCLLSHYNSLSLNIRISLICIYINILLGDKYLTEVLYTKTLKYVPPLVFKTILYANCQYGYRIQLHNLMYTQLLTKYNVNKVTWYSVIIFFHSPKWMVELEPMKEKWQGIWFGQDVFKRMLRGGEFSITRGQAEVRQAIIFQGC